MKPTQMISSLVLICLSLSIAVPAHADDCSHLKEIIEQKTELLASTSKLKREVSDLETRLAQAQKERAKSAKVVAITLGVTAVAALGSLFLDGMNNNLADLWFNMKTHGSISFELYGAKALLKPATYGTLFSDLSYAAPATSTTAVVGGIAAVETTSLLLIDVADAAIISAKLKDRGNLLEETKKSLQSKISSSLKAANYIGCQNI
jgi:hypothetical protein